MRLLIASSLVLFSVAADAQQAPRGFVMPLRADDIVTSATGAVVIRGTIEWRDGRTTNYLEIRCSGKDRQVVMLERRLNVYGAIWGTWPVEPEFCAGLAASVQKR
ncbi:MAG TPA: hypothetical protein VH913_02960 [Hyphomicrobiaceae bacterium]|jgi:hypothetical protein